MNNSVLECPSLLILNALPNIGPIALKRLLAHFGPDPRKIFQASKRSLMQVEGIGDSLSDTILNWKTHFNLEKEIEYLQHYNARFVPSSSPDYPPLLKEIYDPPIGLYFLGNYIPQLKTIAIVGSRRSTLYGLKVAKQLAMELAQLGFCIVSGMARGADSAAHEGALEAGGKTIAVLGSGPNIIYPPENKKLYEKIQESGAVISELPFNKQADKTTFPRRNRIVSGIAQAVIVVETNSNGGSMITAKIACEQGRHVFAVPGRIDQISSKGCLELIREGASLCTGVDVILEELNYLNQLELPLTDATPTTSTSSLISSSPPTFTHNLSEIEHKVLTALKAQIVSTVDLLSELTQEPTQKISSTLLLLELKKLAIRYADGTYEINI